MDEGEEGEDSPTGKGGAARLMSPWHGPMPQQSRISLLGSRHLPALMLSSQHSLPSGTDTHLEADGVRGRAGSEGKGAKSTAKSWKSYASLKLHLCPLHFITHPCQHS